ncbi:hypothetical protein [Aliikangiella sp. IMCC44359]|uniref:hypothetical protein n=1 Tax=Aliikangiella sp. IMCC44359 TaxID=3459125 RepID=UPI00403AD3B0
MKKLILVSLLVGFISPAFAELKSHSGKITGYIVSKQGVEKLFFLKLEGITAGGCSSTGRLAIDSSSPSFDATQSAIMAAFHSKTDVNIYYNDTCNTGQNAWDILWVCVGDIPC